MRSLRKLAQQQEINTGLVSLRELKNRFQASSLKQLFAAYDVQTRYNQLGSFNSPLGLAINGNLTAQEIPVVESNGQDGFISSFRGGSITLTNIDSPPVVQSSKMVKIWLVGLECRLKQESVDEILGSVGVVVPSKSSTKALHFPTGGEYYKVGNQVISLEMPIYDDAPADIVLSCILVEHDSGNIDEYKKKIAEALTKAAQAGLGSLTGVPAEATAADQGFINDVSLGLVNLVAGWLGVADDAYTPQALRVSARDILIAHEQKYEKKRLDEPAPFPERVLQRADTPGKKLTYNTDPVIVSGIDDGGDKGEYVFYFRVELRQVNEIL